MKDLQQKFDRLKKMPIKVAVMKIGQKVINRSYHIIRKNIIQYKPINIESKLFYKFTPACSFFFSSLNKDNYTARLSSLNINNEIINDADQICNHIFNLLGSGKIDLGIEIPWNKDFKTGFEWANQYYKDIKLIDFTNNADVKVPWELSRFQHLFTLGKAYWITNNEKYAIEFKEQIENWLKKNPIEMSVNWTCTMDVAIRAVNWILAYSFFRDSKEINETFWLEFNKSLYLHGKFIFKNLENKHHYTGNHYLSNIVGLVWLGLYFKNFKVASIWRGNTPERWLEFGGTELEKEMQVQVNMDGTNYEASTSYHRLVTELFLITTILGKKNSIIYSVEYLKRLEKMCEFVMNLTQPNGKSPLIGDADDGRLLILSHYGNWERDDFRHLLSLAGEFFNRNDFRFFAFPYKEDALWLFGKWNTTNKVPSLKSAFYPDGGYYILRNDKMYCIIRCGENSIRGEGVHSHNDQLSFTLNVNSEDIFIDPGAFIYTADYKMRNLFRSTGMHNTLKISDFEQNDLDPFNLFSLKEQTFSECIKSGDNIFIGQHNGYLPNCGILHKRSIKLGLTKILIIDELVGSEESQNYMINYILSPGVIINIKETKVYLTKNNVNLEMNFDKNVRIKEEHIHISIGYGTKKSSKKLVIECNSNLLETSIQFTKKG